MGKKKEKKQNESEEMNFKQQRTHYGFNPEYGGSYSGSYSGSMQEYTLENTINGVMINPKQMYWISKRRARRDFLDSLMISQKNNYMHESRHRHAMKRMRAPSGRFLTKEEMNQQRGSENQN